MSHMRLPLFLLAIGLVVPPTEANARPTVYLPPFPIGEPGVFSFVVESPSQPLYPHWLYIKTRQSRTCHPVVWFEDAVLHFDIRDLSSGKFLASRTLPLQRFRTVDGDEYRVLIWGRHQSDLFAWGSYEIRVTVISPSGRRFDKARIQLGGVGG